MELKVEEVNACTRKMVVSVTVDEVNSAYDKALRKISRTVQIPGFRPGKVPRGLMERQYASAIQEEAQSALVDSTLPEALQQADLNPVVMPRLQLGQVLRGEALQYIAFVEVRPTIELQQWEKLPIAPLNQELDPAKVDQELQEMQKNAAELQPVTDRQDVQDTDVVQMDFEGFIDGTPFAGGKAENAMLEMAAGDYIAGFAEALLGATVPGHKEIVVPFPQDYHAKQLAGKEATFKVDLKELKTRKLPSLDDEFAKDLGEDSLETLTQKVRDRLMERHTANQQESRRTAVLQALVAANPIEVPPSMVDSQTDRVVASAKARFERMTGKPMQLTAQQLQNVRQSSVKEADFQVRSGLLLLEVAKKGNLEVTEEEVEVDIAKMQERSPDQAYQIQMAYNDPDRREELRYSLLEDKTVDLLLAHAEETAEAPQPEILATPAAPSEG
jgi:trigger factor